MLKYLKHDISRMKNIIIGFFIAVMALSIGIGVTGKESNKYMNKMDEFYIEESKINNKEYEKYEKSLNGKEVSEEERTKAYEKIESETYEITKNKVLKEKGYDIDEIGNRINTNSNINSILTILMAIIMTLFIGYSILKYREDLFTDRGYLTFSLPIKTTYIIITKYITGVIIPMLILGLGYLTLVSIIGRENILETETAFYMSTTIIVFISSTYMYLALSKTGNKFLEKAWIVFTVVTALVVLTTFLFTVGNSLNIKNSLRIMSIPFIIISFISVFITERIVRKKLTI